MLPTQIGCNYRAERVSVDSLGGNVYCLPLAGLYTPSAAGGGGGAEGGADLLCLSDLSPASVMSSRSSLTHSGASGDTFSEYNKISAKHLLAAERPRPGGGWGG